MLMIATYLDRSTINGIGIFTAEPVKRGQIIWKFNPAIDLVFTARQWKNKLELVTPQAREALHRYSYKSNNKYYLCNDNSQFMNHSEALNNVINNSISDTMYAAREIDIGEELLCNYFEYSDEDDYHISVLRTSCAPTHGSRKLLTNLPVLMGQQLHKEINSD